MVDQADQCSSGETHSVSSPSVGHLHRCLHQRLGSPLRQSISSSSVVSYRDNSTHHRVGAASHSEGCPPPSDQRKGSDDLLGQQLSSCLTPESGGGGHSITAHLSPNMGNPLGVSAAGYHPVSEAHPRLSECSIRWPVEKRSDHRHGMVSAPQHGTPDVLHFVHPQNGPVCNSSQQQTDRVCVSSSRPSAVVVDALSISWDRRWVYAYPPTALMQWVPHKLVHSDQCRMLLVAPLHVNTSTCL